MKRFFQIIKKKKHKRRFSALCLFLIVIELLCPVFCDEPTFAAAAQTTPATLERSFDESDKDSNEKTFSAAESGAQENQQTVCNDECFCHATAIPNLIIPPKVPAFFHSEQIAFHFGESVYNSLPPPYHPPKLS